MFIKNICIKNFRLFSSEREFKVNEINIPDNETEGSGLTVFVGENACGKTSLLNAISLPLLPYKADAFSLNDFFNLSEEATIKVFSEKDFEFRGIVPAQKIHSGKGFLFRANIRSRGNKSYLSSILVSDQEYIKSDKETLPDNSPALRVSVNHPWSGPRFDENDVLYLDKNRTYQTRISNTYNKTRFNRLMEDLDFQYLRNIDNKPYKFNGIIRADLDKIESAFLSDAIKKFEKITHENICLAHINDWEPHSRAFLCIEKDGKQILLENLGSGYEMIFSILLSFCLSQQRKKDVIILIDEPELHLHPKLQEYLVKTLLEFSRVAQIIVTTHSPLFVKQILGNDKVSVKVLKRECDEINISTIEERVLPYLSANEVNFIAFSPPTEEYHSELYGTLIGLHGSGKIKEFDEQYFVDAKKEKANYPWKGFSNEVSIHTFIRNKIHHREENGIPNVDDLKQSIEKMREYLREEYQLKLKNSCQ